MRGRSATILMTFASRGSCPVDDRERRRQPTSGTPPKSVPIGLYRLQPAGRLAVTELVAVRPPEPLATFLDLNGYLPIGVPMLKRVLALPGQTVCRKGLTISVDGIDDGRGAVDATAAAGRCPSGRDVASSATDELFLMNWQSEDSLDGRYLGVVPHRPSSAQALPVWTEGGVTVIVSSAKSPPFLCSIERSTIPPSRPTFATAVARSGGPGRPRGRRDSASPWTAASTMAALRSLGTIACIVAILAHRCCRAVRRMPNERRRSRSDRQC